MSNALNIALIISGMVSGSLYSAIGGVQKSLGKLGDVTKELTARQQRLGSAIKGLSSSDPQLRQMQNRYHQIGQAVDLLASKQKRLNDLIKQGADIKSQREGYRNELFETAGQAAAVGAPVLKSVQLAGGFQDRLRDISITGEFSKAEEVQLGKTIRENSLRFNQTQEDLSKGIGVLVAGGISSSRELAAFAPVLAKAATATRASVDELGSVFIAMRDNLKISAKDSESALNMLTYTGKKGQFEIKDMAKWLPNLAPQMAALGLTGKEAVAEIGAALQIARKGAGTNDEAANNFRNFLAKVTAPDTIKDFQKAGIDLKGDLIKLREQGMTPMQGMLHLITQYMGTKGPEAAGQFTKALAIKDDAEREAAIARLKEAYKLGELFQDMQAMNFIKPAIANAKEMADIKKGALAAGGDDLLGKDLAKRMEGFNERWKNFTIGLKDLGISLGNALLPALTSIVKLVSPLVSMVGTLVNTFPRLTGAIVGIVSGLLLGKMAVLGFLYLKTMVAGFFVSIQTASALASAKLALFRVQTVLAGGALRTFSLAGVSSMNAWIAAQWASFRASWLNISALKAKGLAFATSVKNGALSAISAVRIWTVTQYQSLTAAIAARGGLIGLSKAFAGSVVAGIRAAIVAVRAFSLSLLTSPIGWVALTVAGAAFLIYKYWKPISGFFKGVWQGLKEGLKGLEPAWNIFKKIAPFLFPIITHLKWIWNAVKALLKPVDDVGGAAQNMGVRFGKALAGILTTVLTLPTKMLTAGFNIINSLFEGMKKAINKPVELMKGLAQRLRNFLPFSPAKEGPLKDIHRIRLIETIANTMKPAPMVAAMRTVTAATMLATAAPGFAAPASAGKSGGQGGAVITFAPVINLAPGTPAEARQQVEQALKFSQAEFERMLARAEQNRQRKGF